MILVPFFEIPHRDRLAKNVKSRCVQIIPRFTTKVVHTVHFLKDHVSALKLVLDFVKIIKDFAAQILFIFKTN